MRNTSNKPKQTKETARRARRIRKLRGGRKPMIWEDVCRDPGVQIFKEDGSPDTGLAYKIGFEDYEPSRRSVRARLGLRDFCNACKRAFRPSSSRGGALPDWLSWWKHLSKEIRDEIIRDQYERKNHR